MFGNCNPWRVSAALRLRLICALLLVVVAGAANSSGQAAPLSWQAVDPDLCTLLPTGTGPVTLSPGVGKPGSAGQCEITYNSQNRKLSTVQITKYLTPNMARSFVNEQYANRSNNPKIGEPMWAPATAYGDAGYSYDIPAWTSPYSGEVTGGSVFFARGCYVVQGDAGHDPSDISKGLDPGPLRETVTTVDRQLQKAPCGGTSQPPSNTDGIRVILPDVTSCPISERDVVFVYISRVAQGVDRKSVPLYIQSGNDPAKTDITYSNVDAPDGDYFSIPSGSILILPSNGSYKVRVIGPPVNGVMLMDRGRLVVPCGKQKQPPEVEGNVDFMDNVVGGAASKGEVQTKDAQVSSAGGPNLSRVAMKAPADTLQAQAANPNLRFTVDTVSGPSTRITAYLGKVLVTPKNSALKAITLSPGQRVEVGQTSISPVTSVVEVPGSGIDSHTFPETGKAASGLFLDYWNSHGGLAQQGFPISDLIRETSDLNKQMYTVQYYERAVFEFHPEYAPPNDVLLSQLGTFQYKRKYPQGAPNQKANQTNGNFFKETGHWVGGRFWQYWQSHGGLAQQGYPLSEEFTEVSGTNGKPYLVQYFERAVFEYHPEFAPPNDVLLSLLGVFFYNQKYVVKGTPTTVPAATSTVPPPGPSATATSTRTSAGCVPRPSGMLLGLTGDGTTADTSGSGNNGVLRGNATYASGKAGQAFSFNGSTGYVEVPDSPGWAFGSKDFTIDLWVNFTHVNGINALVANDEGPGFVNKWIFWLNSGFLQLHMNGPYAADINGGQFSPNPGEWRHVAVTRSGATFTFYIDGAARPTATESRAIPDARAPLTVGQAEGQFFVNGLEDEMHIFGRALSGSEIRAIYNAGQAGVCR